MNTDILLFTQIFSLLYHCQDLYRKQKLPSLREHLSSPRILVGTVFRLSLPPFVCRRAHALFTFFVFAYSGVQDILCCVLFVCLPICSPSTGVKITPLMHFSINRVEVYPPTPQTTRPYLLCKTYCFNSHFFLNLRIDIKTQVSNLVSSPHYAQTVILILLGLIIRCIYICEYI